MKTNHLTIKQEAFCQAYVRLGDKSAAYREAYSFANMKADTVNKRASELFKKGVIVGRVKELQAKAAVIADEKFNITSETMLRHLDILRRARIDEYVTLTYVEVEDSTLLFGERPEDYEPSTHKEPKVIFKPFDELTEEQLMCIESLKVNRYGEVELKLHGKEWSIEKIAKHIGFYEKDNTQKANILVPEERASRIQALRDKLNRSK